MLVAVPLRVSGRVVQPEVGGQIDHLGLRRLGEEIAQDLLGRRVRQRAEREIEIGLGPVDAFDRDQCRQLETARTAETPCASPARPCGRRSAARVRRADGAAAGEPARSRCSPTRRARRPSPLQFRSQPWSQSFVDSRTGPPDRGKHRGSFGENAPRAQIRRRRQYQARAETSVRRRRDEMVTDRVIAGRYSGLPPVLQGRPLASRVP